MDTNKYKRKVIIWGIYSFISLVLIIVLAILLANVSYGLNLFNYVNLDAKINSIFKVIRAYCIGGLSFFTISLIVGSIITYSGIKSWKYMELFG